MSSNNLPTQVTRTRGRHHFIPPDENDSGDNKTRRLLAIVSICLMPLPLIVYIFTRDTAIVTTTTTSIGLATAMVYGYYFRRNSKQQ